MLLEGINININYKLELFTMIQNRLFYVKQKVAYPPFKDGLYMEEYFLKKMLLDNPPVKRKYIPAYWTNFQIEPWFYLKRNEMQASLNEWVRQNPSDGYFTVVQHDDSCFLKLPQNTIIYGCSGHIPLPLIYEDKNNTLDRIPKKTFQNKPILCSFVGNITSNRVLPNVRQVMFDTLTNSNSNYKSNFLIINAGGWKPTVNKSLQDLFIHTTIDSKFALAPRGYGRSSFRFFEIFKLGTIPIYIWNDVDWSPFQNVIDYKRLCISIHISEINNLESILLGIDEEKYNSMWEYYETIKHLFELEGMSAEIIRTVS